MRGCIPWDDPGIMIRQLHFCVSRRTCIFIYTMSSKQQFKALLMTFHFPRIGGFPSLPSGIFSHNYGTSPLKSWIYPFKMVDLSTVTVYQRLTSIKSPSNHYQITIKSPFNHHFPMVFPWFRHVSPCFASKHLPAQELQKCLAASGCSTQHRAAGG